MTAAFGHLTGPVLRSSLRGRSARAFTVLAVVLPVPMFATLGLSLPLPGTVERLAAKLVPFGDSGAFDASGTRALGHGSIVLAPGDQGFIQADSTGMTGSRVLRLSVVAAGHGSSRNGIPSAPTATQPHDQTSDVARPTAPATGSGRGTTLSASQPGGDSSSPAPSSGGGPAPSPGGTQPGPGPAPAPSPVGTVTDTASGAVGSATNTVTNATGDATNAANGTVGAAGSGVTGTVGGIHSP